jgi:hypothetical protein
MASAPVTIPASMGLLRWPGGLEVYGFLIFVLSLAYGTAWRSLRAEARLAGPECELDVEGYVQVVSRSHPTARLETGLAQEAGLPVWATETRVSLSQTIPWPGALAACASRSQSRAGMPPCPLRSRPRERCGP